MTTIVFVHAHPDDEALLTGGTMALLAREGHRVVLVTATNGEAGLTCSRIAKPTALGSRRVGEVERAAAALGCARVETLGYGDSGSNGPLRADAFAAMPVTEAARALQTLLEQEQADVVVGYDAAGGYGHRDHQQVSRVVRAAAHQAGTSRLLEATVDRRALKWALRLARPFVHGAPEFRASRFDAAYSSPREITHSVDVRAVLDAKRAAMRAHVSQLTGGDETRTLARFLGLPESLFAVCFGREWYVEVGAHRAGRRQRNFMAHARPPR